MKLRELASNKVNKASQTDELQKSFSTLAAEECNKCVQLEAELKRTLSPQLLHNTMKQVLVDSKLTLDQLIQVMQQNESKSLAEKSESESSNDESNEEDPKSDDKEIEMLHHETNLNQPTVEIDCGQKSSIVNIVKEDKSVQVNLRPIEKDSLVESDAKKPTEADDQIKNPINMSLDFCIQCDLDSTAKHEQTNDQVHQLDQKFEDKSNEDVPFDPHSSSSHIESGERSEEAGLSNKKDEEKSTGDEPARSGERELISHRQVIPDQRAQRMKTESSISIQVNGRNHRETAQFKCETRMNRLGAFSRKAELTNTRQIPILVPNLSIAPVSTPAAIAGDIDSEAANEHIKRTALNRQKSVSAQNLSTDSGGSTSGYVRSQTPAFSESELELTGMRSTSRNSLTTDWCQAEQQQSIEIVAPAGQRRSRQIQDESVPKIGRPNAAQRMSWYEESSSNVTSEISADPLRDSGGRTHVPRSVQMKSAASLVVGNGRLGGGGLNCASKVQRQFESDAVTEPIMESNVTLHEPKPVYQSRVAAWSANESQVSSGEAPSAVLDEFDETNSMPDTSEPFEHSDSQSPKLKQQSRLPSTSVQQKSDRSSPRINETSDYSSLAGINTSNSINDEPPSMTKTLTKRQACKNDVKLNVDQPVYSRPRPAERSRDGGSKPGSRVGFYLPNEPDPISYPQKEHDSKSHTRQSQRPSAETSLDQNSNQNNAAKVLETQLDDVCGNYWQPPPPDRSSTPVSRVEPDTATPVQHEIRMMDTVTGQGSRERSLYRAHRPTSFHPNDQSSGDPIETENRRAELESPLEQTLKLNEQPDGTEIVTNITKTSFPVLRKSTGRFGCSRQTTTHESSTCGCTNRTSGSAVRAERSTCGSRCRSRSRSHYTDPEDRPLSVSNSNLTNLFKRNRLVFEQLLRTPEPRSANQAAACANDSVHSGRPTESNCAGCRIDSQITMDLPIPRQRNASNCKRTSGSSCASTTSTGGRARRAPVTGSMDDLDRKSLASSHSHSQLSGQFVTSSHFRRTRPTTNASLNRAMSSSQQMLSAAGLRASETDWQYTMQCKCTNSSNANVL